MRQYALLIFGVFCCSTAVIFIKYIEMHPLWLSAVRLFGAALCLSFFARREYTQLTVDKRYTIKQLGLGVALPALFLATHFMSWIYGARLTPAAHSTLIVNLIPLVSPILLFLLLRERVNRFEWLGTVLAISGIMLLVSADAHLESAYVFGDMLCFGSMILNALYLVSARQYKDRFPVWSYLTALYTLAGVLCFLSVLLIEPQLPALPMHELLAVLGIIIVPTLIGHSLLNNAMRHMRGQLVTMANTGQCVFAGIMALFIFNEYPSPMFYWAALFVVLGIVVAFVGSAYQQKLKNALSD